MKEINSTDDTIKLQEMKMKFDHCESKTNGQTLELYPLDSCNKNIKKELEYECWSLNTEQGLDISENPLAHMEEIAEQKLVNNAYHSLQISKLNNTNDTIEREEMQMRLDTWSRRETKFPTLESHLLESCDERIKKELEFESVFLKTEQGLDIDKNSLTDMEEITEEKFIINANNSLHTFKMETNNVTVKLEEMKIELDKWYKSCTINGEFDLKKNISHIVYEDMDIMPEERNINEVSTVTQPEEISRASTIIHKYPDQKNNTLNYDQLFCHTTAFQDGDRNAHRAELSYEETSNVECDYQTQKIDSKIHKDVSEIKIFKCEICAYVTNTMYTFKCHMIIHKKTSDIKMYICEICNYQAKRKDSLKKHMLIHKDISDIKMFKCEICSYQGKQKSHLKCHMLIHKNLSETEMFKCGICTFETKLKNTLKRHMLIHQELSVIEMFQCEICTYKAKRRDALQIHMLIHKKASETERFKCEMCTYESKRKKYLKAHLLVHKEPSEIKMFKCEICTYEVKYKNCLKNHMLIHK